MKQGLAKKPCNNNFVKNYLILYSNYQILHIASSCYKVLGVSMEQRSIKLKIITKYNNKEQQNEWIKEKQSS